jgi:outer membrane usher protein
MIQAIACLFLLVLVAHGSVQAQAAGSQTSVRGGNQTFVIPIQLPIQDYVAQIRLNGALTDFTVPVVRVEGLGWLMDLEDFKRLRLVNAKPSYAVRGEQELVSLDRTRGIAVLFNERKVELDVTAGVSQFETSRIDAVTEKPNPTLLKQWGGYFNYEATATKSRSAAISQPTVAGSAEAVLFSPWGSLVHQVLASKNDLGESTIARLDSYFQRDFPEQGLRLRIGDNVTSSGAWGRSLRFGGFKIGTDYSVRPDLVTLPGVSVAGASAVPSVVDVFVNGTLQGRYNVAAGPFSVDRVPVVSGTGTVRLVVRNALGLEQTIEAPFFRTNTQLEKGVSDYSIEAGVLREQFSITSNRYTEPVAVANWRYGLNSELTTELRSEYSKKNIALGAGLTFPVPGGHSVSPSVAISRNESGQRGWSGLLGYGFSGQALRFAARFERNSENFQPVGAFLARQAPLSKIAVSGGYRFSNNTDIGLAFTDTKERTGTSQSILSINSSIRLTRDIILSASISRIEFDQVSSHLASIQFYWTSDGSLYGSLSSQATNELNRTSRYNVARVGSNLDTAGGASWELEAASQDRYRARASYLGSAGQLRIEHQQQSSSLATSQSVQRVSVNGAIVVAGGSVVPSRTIDDSFILVQAEPTVGASVFSSGGSSENLDRNGNLVLNRVQPYRESTIRVNAEKLGLDVTLTSPDLKTAVPARAGGIVKLGLKRSLPVTFELLFNGKPVVVETVLTINGEKVPVGEQGLVFLQDAQPLNQLRAEIGYGAQKQVCNATFEVKNVQTMADLGKIVCQ